MPEGPAIRTEKLAKSYGTVQALRALDLEVPRGVVAGFLGPNGAGKTTTLRMLTGLVRPSGGSYRLSSPFGAVGALVEAPSFPPYMSGRETLVHLARLKGVTRPEGQVDEVLARVGIATEAWGRNVGTYSTGMRGRLGIAFALLGQPELVILDEPTRGLDPEGRRLVLEALSTYARENGATVFVSSHLLWEVEALADWVAVLHRGQGIFQGSIEALRALKGEGGILLRAEPAPAAQACCDRLGWSWTALKDGLRIALPEEAVPDLVAALVADGVRVRAVEPCRETLEDLYLQLTKEAA